MAARVYFQAIERHEVSAITSTVFCCVFHHQWRLREVARYDQKEGG
jgi:hypothetical protein